VDISNFILYIIRYSLIQILLIFLPKTAYNRHLFLAEMIIKPPQSTQTILGLLPVSWELSFPKEGKAGSGPCSAQVWERAE
jgi:hypothetical protein